jgi:hypothetical protein
LNLVADAAWVTQSLHLLKEISNAYNTVLGQSQRISEITIQDFPLKGKFIYLQIKR